MSYNSFIRKKIGMPVEPRINKGKCYFCDEDVFVAVGQAFRIYKGVASHKKCRPKKGEIIL